MNRAMTLPARSVPQQALMMPEQEEAIFVKLGDENSHIPAGKTVIEYELSKLVTPDMYSCKPVGAEAG